MKVTHVLTLVSSTGEYGGPQAVADNLAGALTALGHQVEVIAGRRTLDVSASAAMTSRVIAVPVRRLMPRGGVSELFGWRMLTQIVGAVRRADVVHIHFARDAVPVVAAVVALVVRRPYVVQTHGMVQPDRRPGVRFGDRFVFAPLLRRASERLVLTETERASIQAVAGRECSAVVLPNGNRRAVDEVEGEHAREALFLARIHPRKRVMDFARAAVLSGESGIRFRVVGPDGGQLAELLQFMQDDSSGSLVYEGALAPRAVRARLIRSGVFVLPSEAEPFPMAVVEALQAGLPCVVTESCAIAPMLSQSGAALVVPDGRPDLLAGAVRQILDAPGVWQNMRQAALRLSEEELNLERICVELAEIYGTAVASTP